MIEQAADTNRAIEDAEVRFLEGMAHHLQILERDIHARSQGSQGHAQVQFDELVHRFDAAHAALVERGFLPLPK